jgi:mannan endo-1,4-beta-mannosidase
LIWVWTTTSSEAANEWFPGWDVIDVVGMDIYKDSGDYNSLNMEFWKAYEIFGYKKLVSLAENGPIPDLNQVVKDKAAWSWFGTWSGYFLT